MRKPQRQAEVETLRSELDEVRPYLGLAREIHDEVRRVADDPAADAELIVELIDSWPRDARRRLVEAAFDQLPASERWAILAELFDDDELRAALARQHEQLAVEARQAGHLAALAGAVATRHALDTRDIPAGEQVTLGLFRESDVGPALTRGRSSSTCARRLVLRATGHAGRLHVIEDVFNPGRGLFVTSDYDEQAWRDERLAPHSLVRVGALEAAGDRARFRPVVYPGGRVDIEVGGSARRGRLHAGYAAIGDLDLFTGITP